MYWGIQTVHPHRTPSCNSQRGGGVAQENRESQMPSLGRRHLNLAGEGREQPDPPDGAFIRAKMTPELARRESQGLTKQKSEADLLLEPGGRGGVGLSLSSRAFSEHNGGVERREGSDHGRARPQC